MIIIDPDLDQRTDWKLESGPDINDPPADEFIGQHLDTSEFRITNMSSQQWGGALLVCKRQVPLLTGSTMSKLTYVGMDMEYWIDGGDFSWLWAHETDLKCCVEGAPDPGTKIPNVFNFSAQVNMGEGGRFQINDVEGDWVDTGILLPPKANMWNALRLRYRMDIENGEYSFLSVNEMPLEPEGQNMPLLVTNWQPVAAVQLQNEVAKPGVLNIKYRNILLIYSDQPFATDDI